MSYRVLLINPPWAAAHAPSIAIEQLATVLDEHAELQCAADVRYLNHAFGRWVGYEPYAFVSGRMESHNAGFGEWFFRAAAFGDQLDNWTAYRKRYVAHLPAELRTMLDELVALKRPSVEAWLDAWLTGMQVEDYFAVGITSMFQQTAAGLAIARLVKKRCPSIRVIMGGANCEGPMGAELIHAFRDLDFVCCGHALQSFPRLIGALIAGDSEAAERTDGVLTRRNCRPSSETGSKPALSGISDLGSERPLDEVVEPNYEAFLNSYADHFADSGTRPELFFETSRGCWWGQRAHCTFCGLNGGTMAYRAMASDRARDHLDRLLGRYSGRVQRFSAVDNILPKEYVRELFGDFRSPEGVSIFYEVKADLGRAALRTLAAAGVTEVQPGIEALFTPTLKLMRKGTTSMHNVSFLDDCRQLDVLPAWNLLVGFPGETDEAYEHYMRVLPDLTHLPPPFGVFPVRFDRFSPYFVQAESYGLELEPLEFYAFIYPLRPQVLDQLAYYFKDRNYRADYIQAVARWIGPLSKLVAHWHVRYNGRDGLPRSVLCGERGPDERWTVNDGRSGKTERWTADADTSELIDRLQRPMSTDSIPEQLKSALESLRARHLVFEERDRVLSLVRIPILDANNKSLAWEREARAPVATRNEAVRRLPLQV